MCLRAGYRNRGAALKMCAWHLVKIRYGEEGCDEIIGACGIGIWFGIRGAVGSFAPVADFSLMAIVGAGVSDGVGCLIDHASLPL